MIEFAQNLTTCRKLLFARAFTVTHASAEVYDDSEGKDDPCGHCDNVSKPYQFHERTRADDWVMLQCQRDPASVAIVDYSVDGYRALKILEGADRVVGTVTLAQAIDLVRGLKGGSINVQSSKKHGKQTAKVDVVKEAGAKVSLNSDASHFVPIGPLAELG